MPLLKKIAILGASGYTGAELVRLIATHPMMEIVALSADRKAGPPHTGCANVGNDYCLGE